MSKSLLIFAAITVGVIIQQAAAWFMRSKNKRLLTAARLVVLIYWVAVGLIIMVGGIAQPSQEYYLPGVSEVALGLGLMLSAVGQTSEKSWLKIVGVIVLSVGPFFSGFRLIQSGDGLGGMIALSLGLGILITALTGWVGGLGQVIIGAVFVGSGVMLLIDALLTKTGQIDFANGAIGIAMFLVGLWVIISGAITVIGSIRQSTQTIPPSVS